MSNMIELPFETDGGFGSRATIGLVVLETDHTVEPEFRSIDIDGVAWYHARIHMEPEVTPETLTDMRARLPEAAKLLPAEFNFDAIGYGCTSAATLIGEEGVTGAIRTAHPDMACSNPISAAVEAFRALEVSRIAVVTPYTADVTAPIIEHFRDSSIEVENFGSFNESSDHVVARISPESIANAVREIVSSTNCEGVFVSCTSLRTFDIVDELETELGVPVVSSNLALSWHLLRLAGIDDSVPGLGQLFRRAQVQS